MLELQGVSTVYGRNPMLRHVTVALREGEIACLLGPNGAGKTTLIRTILGLVRPVEGSVFFQGERIDRLKTNQIVRRGIGVVPEGRRIFPKMTVAEKVPPTWAKLVAEGSGSGSSMKLTSVFTLDGDNPTTMSWSADAEIGGVMAGLGSTVLRGFATRKVAEIFEGITRAVDANAS